MKKILILFFLLFSLSACVTVESTKSIYEIETDYTEIINKACEATTYIEVKHNLRVIASGSGVLYKQIEDTCYVLTNAHVVVPGNKYKVYINRFAYDAKLIYIDVKTDIAILTVQSLKTLTTLKLADYNTFKKGQSVISVGTPLSSNYYNTTTIGRISGLRTGLIQHDAAINPGNSGGPLLDMKGNIIGLNTKKITYAGTTIPADKMGFAIDINKLNAAVKHDTNTEEIIKNTLGIEYITVHEYVNRYNDFSFIPADIQGGLIILSVDPIHENILLKHDIIVEMNNKPIIDEYDYLDILWNLNKGDKITFKVYRNLKLTTIVVTLQ